MSIPAQSNPPINPQYFQPSRFVISDVSRGETTAITTSEDQNYVVGQVVRMIIPPAYGCRQLSDRQALVISIISSTEVEIDLDSRDFSPFVSSPAYSTTPPQIMAIGDFNSGIINSSGRVLNGTYILGSFINISPN